MTAKRLGIRAASSILLLLAGLWVWENTAYAACSCEAVPTSTCTIGGACTACIPDPDPDPPGACGLGVWWACCTGVGEDDGSGGCHCNTAAVPPGCTNEIDCCDTFGTACDGTGVNVPGVGCGGGANCGGGSCFCNNPNCDATVAGPPAVVCGNVGHSHPAP